MGKSGSWEIDREWEKKRTQELLSSVYPSGTTIIEDKAEQKAHGDLWVPTEGGVLGFELKIVRYQKSIGGITIETHSALEHNTPGWIYYSGADILDWVFLDAILRWPMPALRAWWAAQDENRWQLYDTSNMGKLGKYTTRCRRVPIRDIPVAHGIIALP